jgi:hypothetical protein
VTINQASNRIASVTVEYDGAGASRVRKTFSDPFAARRFYAAKDRAGKRPRIVAAAR